MNNKKNKASISLQIFCIYTIVVGLILMTIPHIGLSLLDIHMGDEIWARITGLLAVSLGIIAYISAKYNYLVCIQYSVWLRYLSCIFFITMVILGKFDLTLLIFGIIDGLGATWTLISIKMDKTI